MWLELRNREPISPNAKGPATLSLRLFKNHKQVPARFSPCGRDDPDFRTLPMANEQTNLPHFACLNHVTYLYGRAALSLIVPLAGILTLKFLRFC
nr:hypothetical protein CFP56_75874 [Quercus suber]